MACTKRHSQYTRNDEHALAVSILVGHIVSIGQGLGYANKVEKPEAWSRLAKAQLDRLHIKDSIGQ